MFELFIGKYGNAPAQATVRPPWVPCTKCIHYSTMGRSRPSVRKFYLSKFR